MTASVEEARRLSASMADDDVWNQARRSSLAVVSGRLMVSSALALPWMALAAVDRAGPAAEASTGQRASRPLSAE